MNPKIIAIGVSLLVLLLIYFYSRSSPSPTTAPTTMAPTTAPTTMAPTSVPTTRTPTTAPKASVQQIQQIQDIINLQKQMEDLRKIQSDYAESAGRSNPPQTTIDQQLQQLSIINQMLMNLVLNVDPDSVIPNSLFGVPTTIGMAVKNLLSAQINFLSTLENITFHRLASLNLRDVDLRSVKPTNDQRNRVLQLYFEAKNIIEANTQERAPLPRR